MSQTESLTLWSAQARLARLRFARRDVSRLIESGDVSPHSKMYKLQPTLWPGNERMEVTVTTP